MKHFYLIANPSKPGALDMAEKLETELLRRGASCVHARGYTRADQIPADTECIITLVYWTNKWPSPANKSS